MRWLVALSVIALVGCGSDSSATSSAGSDATTPPADIGREDRIDPTQKCYFTGDFILDGVTRGMRAGGCSIGSINDGVVMFGMTDLQGMDRLQIQFYLDEPVAPGQTGAIRVKDVKAYVYTGSASRKWVGTSCTLSITRNEADPVADAGADSAADGGVTKFHFRAWGTGSCSAPFTPETTGTLSIGLFELMFDATR